MGYFLGGDIQMTQLWTDDNVKVLAAALTSDPSAMTIARALHVDISNGGERRRNFEEIWPLLRVAYEANRHSLVAGSNLPVISYPINEDVNLEGKPLGFGLPVPNIELKKEPTEIAGYTVDFPLGVPASMITGNSKYLKHYAERGFCILTYKTVRSRRHEPRSFPHWVFLENGSARVGVEELREAVRKDPKNYFKLIRPFVHQDRFPDDPSHSSMANSFGIPSLDPEGPSGWMADVSSAKEFVRSGHQVLIVSVVATGTDEIKNDFVRTAEMAKTAGADIIELNLSCPNTAEKREGEIFNNPEDAAEIVHAVKKATRIPLFIKTGYVPEEKIRELLVSTESHIDGVVAMNTVSARIDRGRTGGGQFFPDRPTAGVSGWAIKDVAQEMAVNLVKIRKELQRPELCLVGLGGVMNKADFWERIDTGVNAVEICTAAFLDPLLGIKIRDPASNEYVGRISGRMEQDGMAEINAQANGSTSALPKGEVAGRVSPVQGEDMGVRELRSKRASVFDDPSFTELLDPETKAILTKIQSRTEKEVIVGLIKTGVLTPDGRHLTKKYGGA
jgi:dihydroorotate dehydrogenase